MQHNHLFGKPSGSNDGLIVDLKMDVTIKTGNSDLFWWHLSLKKDFPDSHLMFFYVKILAAADEPPC